ncbi:MAG TPA: sulfotransferase [Thermoanaerobaculia bacterium]|nr:sulfotransferase [Thermoanaerobaculia bacterium]
MTNFTFVMAHSFSGSTLLSFLLGAHPEIATVGEMFIAQGIDPETYLCSCGERIAECPLWRRVSLEMAARGIPYDVRRNEASFSANGIGRVSHLLLAAEPRGAVMEAARGAALALIPGAKRELDRRLRINEALAEVILEMRGARAFVDASKRPGRLLHLRRISSLDIRVIHLVRDGRAVARSFMRNLGRSAEEGARSWAASTHDAERVRRLFPAERWLTLRHEDLCREPESNLDRVLQFMGVAPEGRVPDFRSADHHIIGNRMRLSHTSEVRLDERWRTEMPPESIRAVERIAGEALERYGYARA